MTFSSAQQTLDSAPGEVKTEDERCSDRDWKTVSCHPAYGLVEGGLARLANEAGELVLPVHVEAKAPAGVALAVKGAWPKLQAERRNINALHAARKADMGESTSVHGVEVAVSAAR